MQLIFMKEILIVIAAIIIVLGLTQGSWSGSQSNINFFSCGADSDCVLVDASCCPCSMGGETIAINANYKIDWQKRLGDCSRVMCPAWYRCAEYVARCVDGKCKAVLLGSSIK
jgi:hypothetical protein